MQVVIVGHAFMQNLRRATTNWDWTLCVEAGGEGVRVGAGADVGHGRGEGVGHGRWAS
jgi:hypothetical protein